MLDRAAAVRRNPTEPEKKLWMALRAKRFAGYKFRRQATIGNRIADFFCPAKGLVIELDGETHDREKDDIRDARLQREFGFATVRFTNQDVMRNLEGVLLKLEEQLVELPDRWPESEPTTPRPPPLKRRGRQAIAQGLREAAAELASASDTARLDAELLMAHALGVSRSDLLLRHMDAEVPPGYADLLDRRLAHEPVAYIVGHKEFFGLEFQVSPAVLIPRPDSEVLVEAALSARPDARRVLDCGTGSGALLLAVLANLPGASGIGIDNSGAALEIARANAAALGLDERVRMIRADWNEPGWSESLGGPFDLILANPPYVETGAELSQQVSEHEPAAALFAGPEGLDAYRALLPQLPGLLAQGGIALVEIGMFQAEAVSRIALAAGFTDKLHRDLGGRPRVLELTAM